MFSLVVQFYPHVLKKKQESGPGGSGGESCRKSHAERGRRGRGARTGERGRRKKRRMSGESLSPNAFGGLVRDTAGDTTTCHRLATRYPA